jgi:hypothetical protein
MSDHSGVAGLVAEIRDASRNIERADARKDKRLDSIEQSVNELYKRAGRPGAELTASDEAAEHKSAIGLCQIHKSLVAEGDVTAADYMGNHPMRPRETALELLTSRRVM